MLQYQVLTGKCETNKIAKQKQPHKQTHTHTHQPTNQPKNKNNKITLFLFVFSVLFSRLFRVFSLSKTNGAKSSNV
jgi:heme/copper-type cytochrome/quinol oxidase subunit 3